MYVDAPCEFQRTVAYIKHLHGYVEQLEQQLKAAGIEYSPPVFQQEDILHDTTSAAPGSAFAKQAAATAAAAPPPPPQPPVTTTTPLNINQPGDVPMGS